MSLFTEWKNLIIGVTQFLIFYIWSTLSVANATK